MNNYKTVPPKNQTNLADEAVIRAYQNYAGGDPVTGGSPAVTGLSQSHTGTLNCKLHVWRGGRLMFIHGLTVSNNNRSFGIRSKITKFTHGSRRRMMNELAKLSREIMPVYVVTTFPDEFYPNNSNPVVCAKIIDAFRKRLSRRFPGASWVDRREHEKRKSGLYVGQFFPHYNFLIYGVDEFELRSWVVSNWFDVCGRLSADHENAGTYCKAIENWRQMCYYVSKYVSKLPENDFSAPGWGRWWGFHNRACLPWVAELEIDITERDARKLMRYAKRKSGIKRNLQSLHLLTDNPDFWLDRLDDILN